MEELPYWRVHMEKRSRDKRIEGFVLSHEQLFEHVRSELRARGPLGNRDLDGNKIGLWNYRGPEFALEIALLAGGILLYLTRNSMSAARKKAVIAFGLGLIIVQIGDTFVPRNALSAQATAMGVWIFYTLFVVVAYLLERTRREKLES